MAKLRTIARIFLKKAGLIQLFFDILSWRRNMLHDYQITGLYDKGYAVSHGYDTQHDMIIKSAHSKEIIRLLSPAKVLVGGCSYGNSVKALRSHGISTYGFDIYPNLLDVCDKDIKPYLKQGSMLNIPFSSEDKFDTFLATDVFEHIQMKNIPRLASEIWRLEVKYIATIINHDGLQPGHVTLKPLSWWESQFYDYFERIRQMKTNVHSGIYALDPIKYPRSKFTFWERKFIAP